MSSPIPAKTTPSTQSPISKTVLVTMTDDRSMVPSVKIDGAWTLPEILALDRSIKLAFRKTKQNQRSEG